MPKTKPFKRLLEQMAPQRRTKIEAAVQQALLNPTMQQQNLQAILRLVQQLAEFDNVERVKAFAISFPDIHYIDFELELKPRVELSNEIWGKIQDLVIDCEWELRDDSGEKWYFLPQITDNFTHRRDISQVIADSLN
ncbi:hypothetical protein DSM106972_063380 [Dulcicalothrix desertica PCC 7102]|uniref:Uncharacterized protein n=1 Tax=Dulcicalothrix desertica PCC 7102 TaxID=232991 RepID=A0A433V844_9CYAN|nr:hypothetical protein [Dulcicalothrix desertica]RUT02263.1 hypothetical protein DSM106972_063380 [Dulcicalothrix desertica PCC 7102]TWH53901.1 hypothetical protein CAL7102_01896 [Dulcicalothrix desertica PCC 7102]